MNGFIIERLKYMAGKVKPAGWQRSWAHDKPWFEFDSDFQLIKKEAKLTARGCKKYNFQEPFKSASLNKQKEYKHMIKKKGKQS